MGGRVTVAHICATGVARGVGRHADDAKMLQNTTKLPATAGILVLPLPRSGADGTSGPRV